jgi:hypothetical protein
MSPPLTWRQPSRSASDVASVLLPLPAGPETVINISLLRGGG